jgi:hypothetical protein
MPAKKTTAAKTPTPKKAAAPLKSPAKANVIAAEEGLLKLPKNKSPKNLDRLYIPGMSVNVAGYDAGIPEWLFASGVTVQVDKNWDAKPNDVISVGRLLGDNTVQVLATKQLKPGEEQSNYYFFAMDQKSLPDGPHALVYVVHYEGGPTYDQSYPLVTIVKTDLPAGDDKDQIEPGHSELRFSVSETVIVPANASRGVTVTCRPYPNAHPLDQVILHWGGVVITQITGGALQPTVITVTYQDIVDAGDSDRLSVWFEVIDIVGNISTPGSATLHVSVNLDITKYDGPSIVNGGPPGYVDLEFLNEQRLELQLFTPGNVGVVGDLYDVMYRAYPPKGGVKVIHKFVPIERPGRPHSAFIDYMDVRAAAEGRIETSFVLRKSAAPYELYSKKTSADVKGSIVRLGAPDVEGYPGDHIPDDPEHVIVNIPYYAWRQPTDEIALILRMVVNLNEVIVHIETQTVGASWPDGSPVKRLLYRDALQKFKGYRPELYYVISTGFTRARAIDLNESLRRVLTIS